MLTGPREMAAKKVDEDERMAIEIKAPQFPESIEDGTIATWHFAPGDAIEQDDLLVDIETDKVVLEVVAPASGVLSPFLKQEGDTVLSLEVLATIEEGAVSAKPAEVAPAAAAPSAAPVPSVAANSSQSNTLGPAVRKLLEDSGLTQGQVKGSGPQGRITKEDVQAAIKAGIASTGSASVNSAAGVVASVHREEKRVPMTRLRARVAERLMQAKNSTAMLTTFNEVNMGPIMALRGKYKEAFEKKHGIKLGFMSFFVRAVSEALKQFPEVNASIDGKDIVYHGYCDIGVAVSSPRGLVVPILRDCEHKGFADIESEIVGYGQKARDGKLSLEEMTGGTFTISNGGTFGSLMSTPILNPPQTAILGMHKIQERPMAVNGQVVIQPMMYLALSYDHRMVDGKEAVQFLVAIKNMIEDPARLLLLV